MTEKITIIKLTLIGLFAFILMFTMMFTQIRFHMTGNINCNSGAFDIRSYQHLNQTECIEWIQDNCNMNITKQICG